MSHAPLLTLRALNRATLARQLLLERARLPVLRAVERLGGLQAQLPRPPFVALWSRLRDFRRERLARLLANRRLVRGTFWRHTIHLVSARDYLAWRGTVRSALEQQAGATMRRVRVDRDVLVAEARALFLERPRTFGEVSAALASRHPEEEPTALTYTVRTLLPLLATRTGASSSTCRARRGRTRTCPRRCGSCPTSRTSCSATPTGAGSSRPGTGQPSPR